MNGTTASDWCVVPRELSSSDVRFRREPTRCFQFERNGKVATGSCVVKAWESCPEFRALFLDVLSLSTVSSTAFETCALGNEELSEPFFFYLREQQSLRESYLNFRKGQRFATNNKGFANYLLLPVENDGRTFFLWKNADGLPVSNFDEWLQNASIGDKNALWRELGVQLRSMIWGRPVWVTAVATDLGLQISISGTCKHTGRTFPAYIKANFEHEYTGRGNYVNCNSMGRTYVKPTHPDAQPWGGM
jgi:hypothetical protein